MLDQATARQIVEGQLPDGLAIADDRIVELRSGWFFPYRATGAPMAGSQGAIVNKANGRVFRLGSAFPVERDLVLYDKGYQSERYDLVITSIADLERTMDALEDLGVSIVEPKYEHGTVWRIPRPLTRVELRARLARLPCVLDDLALYFKVERLEQARDERTFEFEVLPYQKP
jgi:hypothetical protein